MPYKENMIHCTNIKILKVPISYIVILHHSFGIIFFAKYPIPSDYNNYENVVQYFVIFKLLIHSNELFGLCSMVPHCCIIFRNSIFS